MAPPSGYARLAMSDDRRGDFTHQAEAYAKARPEYPPSLVRDLVALVGVASGDVVADVGAGTGISSRQLADAGLRVIAVEPNAAMRATAIEDPRVTWQDGTFEATGLATESVAWVVAAQAFHWADPPRALPELRRVLRPGGAFTAMWNDRDYEHAPLLTFTKDLIATFAPDFDEGYKHRDWANILVSTGDFEYVVKTTATHAIRAPKSRFMDLWRSHNTLNVAIGRDGVAKMLTEIDAAWPRFADDDGLATIAYVAKAWTAWRRGELVSRVAPPAAAAGLEEAPR
jgi:SAM-dependent methyltransferase